MNRDEKELIQEFDEHEKLRGLNDTDRKIKIREIEKYLNYLERNGKLFSQVRPEDVKEYIEWRYRDVKPRTINRGLSNLDSFYRFLVENEKALFNPAAPLGRLPEDRDAHYGIFTEEEVKGILKCINNTITGIRDRAVFELVYSTGIRLNELVGLDIDDVDFKEKEILVRAGKGDKERKVPVGEKALEKLEEYLEIRYRFYDGTGENALFLGIKGKRLSKGVIQERFRLWKKKSGVTSKGCVHALRHSFASHLLKRGVPAHLIMRMLGHENLMCTEIYLNIPLDDLVEVYEKAFPEVRP
jgi:integrase/recombinase XerC